jgi:predicted TIM-barrel fold metal-dependent hydrolase
LAFRLPGHETMTFKNTIEITDPHCHFWDLSSGFNEWISDGESEFLGPLKPLNQNYLPEDYLKDAQDYNIKKFIHIEAASSQYAKKEIDWLLALANKTPQLGGIVAGVDLLKDDIEKTLDDYHNISLIKGVRQILNHHQLSKYTAVDRPDDLINPTWQKHFALLAKYNLSFDMQICPTQMDDAYQLAKKYSDTVIIVNHAGFPIKEELEIWQAGIKQLSKCPNVYIKLSGFGMLDHIWTADSIKDQVNFIIDYFDVDRCMFASNFPVDRLYTSFSTMIENYLRLIHSASQNEKEKLFSKNTIGIYRISL